MVPVSSILVLGKASYVKMFFLVILFDQGLAVGVRGGAALTQKSDVLSG